MARPIPLYILNVNYDLKMTIFVKLQLWEMNGPKRFHSIDDVKRGGLEYYNWAFALI